LFVILVGIAGGFEMRDNFIDFDYLYKEFKNAKTPRQRTDIIMKFSDYREKSLNFLLMKLESEQDDSVRADILGNISILMSKREDAERILPYMHDSNCRVRFSTLSTLVMFRYKNINDLLKRTILSDNCKQVKALAIWSFGDMGNKKVIPFLEDYKKKNNDEQINKAIDRTLEKLKKPTN
jgi:HEAT repeat protein